MKKSVLFSMALVAALSSCTKDNVDNNNENNDLVAIKLGASANVSATVSRASRAPLETLDGITDLGLYAIAKNAEASWDIEAAADDASQPVYLWRNVKGTVATANVTVTGAAQYYPRQSTNNYSFYGYYPTENITPVESTDKVVATYTIDGSQDIIHGKAVATALGGGQEGYNAAYIREGGENPSINFEHKLTQIKFNFRREEGFNDDAENTQDLKVKSIVFKDQPVMLDLVIADKSEATSGDLTINDGNTNDISVTIQDAPVSVNVSDDEGTGDVVEGNVIGNPVMLFTDDATTSSYTATIELTDNKNTTIPPVDVTFNAPGSGYFKAGTSYTVNILIKDFTPIVLSVSLEPWVDGGSIDGGEI